MFCCGPILVYNHSKNIEEEWGGLRTPLKVAISKDGKEWHNGITLEDEPSEYFYTAIIHSKDGLIHDTYKQERKN